MTDYISRQAAIEYIRMQRWRRFEGMTIEQAMVKMISEVPSVQPERWIPCSERLPDAQTEVIVSCTDDSGDTKFRYTSSGWVTTDKEYWIVDNEINNFVVAWREMPEPYKGEQE